MPAQSGEAEFVRLETTDTEDSLPGDAIDPMFDKAEVDYDGYSREVIVQAVVVMRLRQLWLVASREVTYKQNETSENLSDMAKNLKPIFDDAKKKLDELVAKEKAPAVAFGKLRKIPKPRREYPRS